VQTVGDLTVLQLEQMMVDPVEHLDGVGVDVGTRKTQIGVQTCLGDGVPHLLGDESGALGAAALVDHLTPPMRQAELYDSTAEIDRILREYAGAQSQSPQALVTASHTCSATSRARWGLCDCAPAYSRKIRSISAVES
jgi:hypothetical protein